MHAIDMSRLIRRKPEINSAVSLRFDWRQQHSEYNSYFAYDNREYMYNQKGQVRLQYRRGAWYAGLATYTVWDDGWDSTVHVVCWIPITEAPVRDMQHQCEKLYAQHMIPVLHDYTHEKQWALERLFEKHGG